MIGIEMYQNGVWFDAAKQFYKYLSYKHEFIIFTDWMRTFERAWYMAIACIYGKNGIYFPVNALTYIHEDAEIPSDDEFDPYYAMLYYEKEVNIQTVDQKDGLKFISDMLNLFKKFEGIFNDYMPQNTQQMLISGFNMIGTLMANIDTVSNQLITQVNEFYDLCVDSELLHPDNLNKFYEYFTTKDAVGQFKCDFLDITDEEKNDTLYYDVHADSNNQYFVNLKIVLKDNANSNQIALGQYKRHTNSKTLKIINMYRIANKFSKLIKNVKLARKTDGFYNQSYRLNPGKSFRLPIVSIEWVSELLITQLSKPSEKEKQENGEKSLTDTLHATLNKLYNIFCSHYTIKNSFDTHFIADAITRLD